MPLHDGDDIGKILPPGGGFDLREPVLKRVQHLLPPDTRQITGRELRLVAEHVFSRRVLPRHTRQLANAQIEALNERIGSDFSA